MTDDFEAIQAAAFAEENQDDDANEKDLSPPAMPELPEGIGLTHEDIKILLAAKNDVAISLDDPILMLVTIFNAYLAENEKLLSKHNKALTSILTSRTEDYVSEVKKVTESLSKSLSDSSLEALKQVFDSQAERSGALKHSMIWCTGIMAVSALINVVIFILK